MDTCIRPLNMESLRDTVMEGISQILQGDDLNAREELLAEFRKIRADQQMYENKRIRKEKRRKMS